MTKIQELKRQVAGLTPDELAAFRRWFAEFDAELWDQQIEADVRAGKLDTMAQKALRDHAEGKSTKL